MRDTNVAMKSLRQLLNAQNIDADHASYDGVTNSVTLTYRSPNLGKQIKAYYMIKSLIDDMGMPARVMRNLKQDTWTITVVWNV